MQIRTREKIMMTESIKKGKLNRVLLTGVAGFIGFHLARFLVEQGYYLVGIDNLNTYYDVQLKLDRLKELGINSQTSDFKKRQRTQSEIYSNFQFLQADLCDERNLNHLFEQENFDIVINLAAQAGVRYSIINPKAYINSNIVGFANLLEASRKYPIRHLIFASSSSVYGNQERTPFRETDPVDNPVSLYAATKRSNELMASTYSHLYGIPSSGLRFFTVYGPWGRPDMAPFLFTKNILAEKPIKVFNKGDLMRDFTYIDDIVEGITKVMELEVQKSDYNIYNIGNHKPEKLLNFIKILEKHLNKKAIKENYPMQDGDVYQTFASIDQLKEKTGYIPTIRLNEGLKKFVEWYKDYYGHN